MEDTMRTITRTSSALLATALVAACAGLNTLSAQVASFGDWPAARQPGTYAFDRLPSQQARADAQQHLEDAAHVALEAAGFAPAAPGATPDVLVQVGARITRYERSPWDDPLWWRGGFGPWRSRPFVSPHWAWRSDYSRYYDREVGMLLRDRSSGAPLYEARATSDGTTSGGDEVLGAMFKAALADFPKSGSVPHSVNVQLSQ
jgi:hypothetical protein